MLPASVVKKVTTTIPYNSKPRVVETLVTQVEHFIETFEDEYDPFNPNDFLAYCARREQNVQQEQFRKALEDRQKRQQQQVRRNALSTQL